MSGGVRKCSFFGCENKSSVLPLFRYPVLHKGICKQWVNNSGNKALLSLTDLELKERRVCCAHFDSVHIRFNGKRHLVEPYAVPRSWNAVHSPEHSKVKISSKRRKSKKRSLEEDAIEAAASDEEDTCVKVSKRVKEPAPLARMEGSLVAKELSTAGDHSTGTDLNHEEFKCDHCRAGITGFRYTCVQCADYDLCSACETRREHPHHYVLRIPAPTPHDEIEMVLQTIRRALLNDSTVHMQAGADWLPEHLEVKQEVEMPDPISLVEAHYTRPPRTEVNDLDVGEECSDRKNTPTISGAENDHSVDKNDTPKRHAHRISFTDVAIVHSRLEDEPLDDSDVDEVHSDKEKLCKSNTEEYNPGVVHKKRLSTISFKDGEFVQPQTEKKFTETNLEECDLEESPNMKTIALPEIPVLIKDKDVVRVRYSRTEERDSAVDKVCVERKRHKKTVSESVVTKDVHKKMVPEGQDPISTKNMQAQPLDQKLTCSDTLTHLLTSNQRRGET